MMMNVFPVTNEHVVDINRSDVLKKIGDAKRLFKEFTEEFKDISLADESSIERAYAAAKERGMMDSAAELRTLIFGNVMTTYGVSYLSDACVSGCTYCPIRKDSVDVETGKPIKRRTLGLDELIEDTQEIIKDGHSHICFLAGDGNLTNPEKPESLLPYLKTLDQMEGIDEIILNVTPQTTETFKLWRDAVKNKSLQFRVFQETYDRSIYQQKHLCGPKKDYDFRRGSQGRAMDAGFDDYGLGVLLGVNPNIVQELVVLAQHADELTASYAKGPARVCLPTANTLKGVNNVEQQYHVSAKANELAYVLAKLAMPEVSLVSSERDTPEMLRVLDKYATNRTVDVQPSVGGNLEQKRQQQRLLKQTTVFSTNPEETKKDYESRGYDLRFRY